MKTFKTESEAKNFARMKNRTDKKSRVYVIIDGPENNFCVCTFKDAVNVSMYYTLVW